MHSKIFVLLLLMASSNIIVDSGDADEASSTYTILKYDTGSYEQSTEGTGFFSIHQEIGMNNVLGMTVKNCPRSMLIAQKGYYKSSLHGSGTINNADLLKCQDKSIKKETDISKGMIEVFSRDVSEVVSGNSDHQMIYSSEIIPVGSGYYNSNPIKYDSKLSKSSFVGIQNLVSHELLYANSIDSEEQFEVNDTFENRYAGGVDWLESIFGINKATDSKSATAMKFSDDVDGAIQIHALSRDGVDIEEYYFGRYQLNRNITFSAMDNTTLSRTGFLNEYP